MNLWWPTSKLGSDEEEGRTQEYPRRGINLSYTRLQRRNGTSPSLFILPVHFVSISTLIITQESFKLTCQSATTCPTPAPTATDASYPSTPKTAKAHFSNTHNPSLRLWHPGLQW